ncbi:MAG: TlpA disulfide reductase family protein [Polyangiales bacterium]
MSKSSTLAFVVLPLAFCASGCGSDIAEVRTVRDTGVASDSCAVTYPPGPYGTKAGDIIEDHTFTGRRNGQTTGDYDQIALSDFYALRNSGKKLLVLNVAAFWCSPCKEEAKELVATVVPKYAPKGVEFLSIVLEKIDRTPTTPADIDIWIKTYHMTFPVADDPDGFVTRFFMKDSMPLNMVIDLATMKIVSQTIGAHLDDVQAVLDANLGG